jgi:hypothetical protein
VSAFRSWSSLQSFPYLGTEECRRHGPVLGGLIFPIGDVALVNIDEKLSFSAILLRARLLLVRAQLDLPLLSGVLVPT